MDSENIDTAQVSESEKPSVNKPVKANDRVTLGSVESERVTAWLKQLEETSKGFLNLTKSDIVNFLVRDHKPELTTKEMQLIRASHYDPIRHLNWITPRLKDAIESGNFEQVAMIQAEIRGIELSVIKKAESRSPSNPELPVKPKRKRRSSIHKIDAIDSAETERSDGNFT